MIKGTSQTFKFKIPCLYDDIYSLKVIFWQDDYSGISQSRPLPIVKTKEQCFENSEGICVTLCPEETLRFSEDRKAYVQLLVKPNSGESFGTRKTMFTVYPVYGDYSADDIYVPISPEEDFVILDGGSITSE